MALSKHIKTQITAAARHPFVHRAIGAFLPYRRWMIILMHVLIFFLSYGMGFVLVYGYEYIPVLIDSIPFTVIPLILIRLAVFHYYRLFEGYWRYVSFEDLVVIIRAVLVGSMGFILLGLLWDRCMTPLRLYVLEPMICTFFVGGIRFLVRNIRENFIESPPSGGYERILLAGPIRHIQALVKDITAAPKNVYFPVAILDPERTGPYASTRLNDIRVFPMGNVPFGDKSLRNLKAVVICWPEAGKTEINHLIEALNPLQAPYKIVPKIGDIIADRVSINDIREVEIEDLLERAPVRIDMEKIRSRVQDRVVMVTGGGGSIGSELCRQISALSPRELVIVERSEIALYELEHELDRKFPDLNYYSSISSINDGPGLESLMRIHGVDTVFHAAAYKHVPLMEKAPVESAYNNILGTYNAVRASANAGVGRFVMVSTDKAVNPTNVMGVTKRISEMVVRSYNGSIPTRFSTVRFGNVLGSTGSVVEMFKKQIAQGGPVAVTHPEMERFFMTISEAVNLILQAAVMGVGGEIFVLDMGRPVKIVSLAEKLITLSGKKPYEDIDIVFSSIRPGEKLYEELFDASERQTATDHPQILKALSETPKPAVMEQEIDAIRSLLQRRDETGLMETFHRLVPGYHGGEVGRGD